MPSQRNYTQDELLPFCSKGDVLVTSRHVLMVPRMRAIGPNCWQGSPGITVPGGARLAYLGEYMFGSDPGPGFPEFQYGDLRLHVVGEDLEYWGRIVKGWCELETAQHDNPTIQQHAD